MNRAGKSLYNGFYFIKIRPLLKILVNYCARTNVHEWRPSARRRMSAERADVCHNIVQPVGRRLTLSIMDVEPQGKRHCNCNLALINNLKSVSFQRFCLYFISLLFWMCLSQTITLSCIRMANRHVTDPQLGGGGGAATCSGGGGILVRSGGAANY